MISHLWAFDPPINLFFFLSFFFFLAVSNSIVVFFRLLTSAWIRLNEDDFAAFLFDPESTGPLSVRQFCESQVEATGKEAGTWLVFQKKKNNLYMTLLFLFFFRPPANSGIVACAQGGG